VLILKLLILILLETYHFITISWICKHTHNHMGYRTLQKNVERLTPSTTARSRERAGFRSGTGTVIFDGTFAAKSDSEITLAIETVTQPIEIFYPPFGELVKELERPARRRFLSGN